MEIAASTKTLKMMQALHIATAVLPWISKRGLLSPGATAELFAIEESSKQILNQTMEISSPSSRDLLDQVQLYVETIIIVFDQATATADSWGGPRDQGEGGLHDLQGNLRPRVSSFWLCILDCMTDRRTTPAAEHSRAPVGIEISMKARRT